MTEMVTVYRFKMWDGALDDDRVARRWATAEAIIRADGAIIRESAIDIDVSHLDGNGMTAKDFDLHSAPLGGGVPHDPLDLGSLPVGTHVMARVGDTMHPAIVVESVAGHPVGPGYVSVRFEPPVPQGSQGGIINLLTTKFPDSVEIGW